jgi:GTP-binding protein
VFGARLSSRILLDGRNPARGAFRARTAAGAPKAPMPSSPPSAPSRHAPLFQSAQFATSVAESAELNRAELLLRPELAFVGRSNAGKSSAINALTQQKQLAFASKTPGRTQLLNFFGLSRRGAGGERELAAYLVDLPGYGFAKVDDATRERWDLLVGDYLATRRMLAGVVLVMDARRPLQLADEDLLGWLQRRERPELLRLHLLLSKADQLSTTQKREALAIAEARAELLPMPTSVQLFSAPKREGLAELQDALGQVLDETAVS